MNGTHGIVTRHDTAQQRGRVHTKDRRKRTSMPQTARARRPSLSVSVEPDSAVLITPARPPLKWAGGKRWQIPHLRPVWAPHSSRRLVEPFCGGLAVTLSLAPKRALLNDVNPHVFNFYQWLKRG